MSTLQVPSSPDDPNFLAMIFHRIDDPGDSGNRKAYEPPEQESLARRQARILDSLAYILVSQAKKDVVAVGVIVTNSDPPRASSDPDSGSEHSPSAIEVLIANNGIIGDDAREYLETVLKSLQEIRKASPGIQGSPRLGLDAILTDTTETHEKLLVNLELSILERVWPKLGQRFGKSHRDTTFLQVVEYIRGTRAGDLTDIPEGIRVVLRDLQSSQELLDQAGVDMGEGVGFLQKLLKMSPTSQAGDFTRRLLHEVHKWTQTLGKHPEFIRNWNDFTSFIIHKNTGLYPAKDPDVLHWLSKVAAPCTHFLRIADIPASRKLSNWLLGDFKVVKAYDPSVHQSTEAVIDHEGVKKVLKASGLQGKYRTEQKITSFLESLSKSFGERLSNGKIQISRPIPVHCECTILNRIYGHTAIPYIGVSKLSCAFCFQYFDAYNSHVPTRIWTRGTHSQSSVWRYPTTLGNAAIRNTFCAKLRDEIAVGWKERGPVSADSQSTDPSADERPDNLTRESKGVQTLRAPLKQFLAS